MRCLLVLGCRISVSGVVKSIGVKDFGGNYLT